MINAANDPCGVRTCMDPPLVSSHRFTLKEVEDWCAENNWAIERRNKSHGEYEYWRTNNTGCGPTDGMIHVEQYLADAFAYMYHDPGAL